MFGERCTLCGGKLDSRRICKECGLNNSKSEKHYQINRSSCDGMPMTHVHREGQEEGRGKKEEGQTVYRKVDTGQKSYRPAEKSTSQRIQGNRSVYQKKKSRWASRLTMVFLVLFILGTIIGSVVNIAREIFFSSDDSYQRPDPYQTLDSTGVSLPEEGTEEEIELPSGKYIVGVNIPAGNYQADLANDYDAIQVKDREHSIIMYEYPAQVGGNYLDDLRLFDGALVEISTADTAILRTENAQAMGGIENPLTKSYEFEGNAEKTAGVDLEAGVYDLIAERGFGIVETRIYAEETEEYEEEYEGEYEDDYQEGRIFMGEGASEGMEFRNVIIPEGARIIIEDSSGEYDESFKVTLKPSRQIMSTDYLQTYTDYY